MKEMIEARRKTQIISAVRKACRNTHVNDQALKVARALELLRVNKEAATNHGLAHYNTRSILKAVKSFFKNRNKAA